MDDANLRLKLEYLQRLVLKLQNHAPSAGLDFDNNAIENEFRLKNLLNKAADVKERIEFNAPYLTKHFPSLSYLKKIVFGLPQEYENGKRRYLLLKNIEILLKSFSKALYQSYVDKGFSKTKQLKTALENVLIDINQVSISLIYHKYRLPKNSKQWLSVQKTIEKTEAFKKLIHSILTSKSFIKTVQREKNGLDFENHDDYHTLIHKMQSITNPINDINTRLSALKLINACIKHPNCWPIGLGPLLFNKKDAPIALQAKAIDLHDESLLEKCNQIFSDETLMPIEFYYEKRKNERISLILNFPKSLQLHTLELSQPHLGYTQIQSTNKDHLSLRDIHAMALAAKAVSQMTHRKTFHLLLSQFDEATLEMAVQLCLSCQALGLEITIDENMEPDSKEKLKNGLKDAQNLKPYQFEKPDCFYYFNDNKNPSFAPR